MEKLRKNDFYLRCGICKYKFNALDRISWNYEFDNRFKEIVMCGDRCRLIFFSSNPAPNHSVEAILSVDLQN